MRINWAGLAFSALVLWFNPPTSTSDSLPSVLFEKRQAQVLRNDYIDIFFDDKNFVEDFGVS
jgi:hypothetical protein